jgi:hypothetical protein
MDDLRIKAEARGLKVSPYLKGTGANPFPGRVQKEVERFVLLRPRKDGGQSIFDIRVFTGYVPTVGKSGLRNARLPQALVSITFGILAPGEAVPVLPDYVVTQAIIVNKTIWTRWFCYTQDPAKDVRRNHAKNAARHFAYNGLINIFRTDETFLALYANLKRSSFNLTNRINDEWRIPRAKLAAYKTAKRDRVLDANAKREARQAIDKEFTWVNAPVTGDIPKA